MLIVGIEKLLREITDTGDSDKLNTQISQLFGLLPQVKDVVEFGSEQMNDVFEHKIPA